MVDFSYNMDIYHTKMDCNKRENKSLLLGHYFIIALQNLYMGGVIFQTMSPHYSYF